MLTGDIAFEDMLHAALLRSPAACGVLKDIRLPPPGARVDVVFARDIPGENRLDGTAMPLLAESRLSYRGEPVAVVVAASAREAARYAADCELRVDEESPAFDMENVPEERVFERYGQKDGEEEDGGGAAGGAVIAGAYRSGMQYHWPRESGGAAAHPGAGGMRVSVAGTDAEAACRAVALALGLPAGAVRVSLLDAGVHFGAKTVYPAALACYAALAARAGNKPARLLLTRDEDYAFAPKRPRARFALRSVLDKNGAVQKTDIDARFDYGAWNLWEAPASGGGALRRSLDAARGVYALGRVSARGAAARTNCPPSGPFCGGAAEGVFALESHANALARARGVNGIDWRKEHLLPDAAFPGAGGRARLIALLDRAALLSDFRRKSAACKALSEKPRPFEDRLRVPRRGSGCALVSLASRVQAVGVVEAEIDETDCRILPRRLLLCLPAGAAGAGAGAERRARLALVRAAGTALGWALFERTAYADGAVSPPSAVSYMPHALSPEEELRVEFVPLRPEAGGAKAGEQAGGGADVAAWSVEDFETAAFCVIPAAFLRAASDAAGFEFAAIPLGPLREGSFSGGGSPAP